MNLIRAIRPFFQAVGWVIADLIPARTPHQPVWGMCEDRSARQEFGRLHGLESGGEALEPGAYEPPHGFGCVSCDGDIATCGCWDDDDDDDEAAGPGGRFYRRPEPVQQRPAFDRDAYIAGLKWPEPGVTAGGPSDPAPTNPVPDRNDQILHVADILLEAGLTGIQPWRTATRIVDLLAADKRIAERLDGAK